jgi:hypothetical protein
MVLSQGNFDTPNRRHNVPKDVFRYNGIVKCVVQPVESLVAAQLQGLVEVCWWHVLEEKLYGSIAVGSNRHGNAVLVLLRGGTTAWATLCSHETVHSGSGIQLFSMRRPSMTMQYVPCQSRCQRQPFDVPGAFFSIYPVATSADKA